MSTQKNSEFENLGEIFKKKKVGNKPPAYEWQDLALRIIQELRVPDQKKSSVFKACKENSRDFIENCLNDTKELCDKGEMWRYFFKLINEGKRK
ncbi:MAG: hypothetical protein ACOCVY_02950 [Patescibacteria group bacterium]